MSPDVETGDTIIARSFAPGAVDDNLAVPPGTRGVVEEVMPATSICPGGQVWVKWENGGRIALLPDKDDFDVVKEAA